MISLITTAKGQNGLESVIVEKYYVSDSNDTSVNGVGGVLPVGSVTYRVWVDMLPDYIFQAAYGDANHECRIETSTLFFNNEDRGATTPTYNKNHCEDNTVMLDSWLSVGAACSGQIAVAKDDDDGVATVVNADGVLQNNDPMAGIPLTQEDGMVAGTPQTVTIVGINNEILVFDNQNDGTNGPVFTTNNGAWSALSGAVGNDPLTNMVCIAQITTDGDLSFLLNLQLRNNLTGAVENYVHSNPVSNEILEPTLTYSSIGVGFTEVNSQPRFNVYPNPVQDYTTLNITDTRKANEVSYRIYNIVGELMVQKNLGSRQGGDYSEQLDMTSYADGVYFVEVLMDGYRSTQRVVKH